MHRHKAFSLEGSGVADIIRRMMFSSNSRNQAELAQKLGVRRAAVTDAKRRGAIPADWYMRLCRMYGVNPIWLESGLGAFRLSAGPDSGETPPEDHADEFAYVPKVAAVPRMGPEGLETDDTIEAYYAFRRDWLQHLGRGGIENLRLMTVAGDSMEPTLYDGDTVLVDQSQREVVFGKIYVIGIDDGIVVKRLDKRPGKLVLISDNRTGYPPVEIELGEAVNVRIIGRVVWMARDLP